MKTYLIIFNPSDRAWAEWVAWQLRNRGGAAVLYETSQRLGSAIISDARHRASTEASRPLFLLSPALIGNDDGNADWRLVFSENGADMSGEGVAIRIKALAANGLETALKSIDLVGLKESDACLRLHELAGDAWDDKTSTVRIDTASANSQYGSHPPYPGDLPDIWNLPSYRNPNFTGREEVFSSLGKAFGGGQPGSTIQAIKGMGGVGKTHIAIEYAYRHASDYQAIWWARAGDENDLADDLAAFIDIVRPKKNPQKTIRDLFGAVRAWLEENDRWLFIFDNATNAERFRDFLPVPVSGHVLITSRHQTWARMCPSISIGCLSTGDSLAYLTRRTTDQDPLNAKRVADALKGLPLALEMAAATMAATDICYGDYLQQYQARWNALWKGKSLPVHFPDAVGTTLSLALDKIQINTQGGALILSLCAYVAPETVPLSMIDAARAYMPEAWSTLFDEPSALNEVLALLDRYALVSVRLDHLSVHRLVQMAARDRLHRSKQQLWSEIALRATASMLPDVNGRNSAQGTVEAIGLSHVRTAVLHAVDHELGPGDISAVLHRLARHFQSRGRLDAAEDHFRRALDICEKQKDANGGGTASILADLAGVVYERKAYEQAEALYRQVLEIIESRPSRDHSMTAACLNNLALCLHNQNQFVPSEETFRKALAIDDASLPMDAPLRASIMSNLGLVLQDRGKYADAEVLYRQSLNIRQAKFGNAHLAVAGSLADLAGVLQETEQYDQAEPLLRQAVECLESVGGADHPRVADTLHSLASLFHDQEQFTHAEPLYRRALDIYKTQLKDSHPSIAVCLNNLARLLHDQENYADAEPLYERALAIYETRNGGDHPSVAICLNNLARLFHDQENYTDAEPLYQRTLEILSEKLGKDHPDFLVSLTNLTEMANDQGRSENMETDTRFNPSSASDPNVY